MFALRLPTSKRSSKGERESPSSTQSPTAVDDDDDDFLPDSLAAFVQQVDNSLEANTQSFLDDARSPDAESRGTVESFVKDSPYEKESAAVSMLDEIERELERVSISVQETKISVLSQEESHDVSTDECKPGDSADGPDEETIPENHGTNRSMSNDQVQETEPNAEKQPAAVESMPDPIADPLKLTEASSLDNDLAELHEMTKSLSLRTGVVSMSKYQVEQRVEQRVEGTKMTKTVVSGDPQAELLTATSTAVIPVKATETKKSKFTISGALGGLSSAMASVSALSKGDTNVSPREHVSPANIKTTHSQHIVQSESVLTTNLQVSNQRKSPMSAAASKDSATKKSRITKRSPRTPSATSVAVKSLPSSQQSGISPRQISSRLTRPTLASSNRRKSQPLGKRSIQPPSASRITAAKSPPPTTSKTSPDTRKTAQAAVSIPNRIFQPTASSKAHFEGVAPFHKESEHVHVHSSGRLLKPSSRLLKPTASRQAQLEHSHDTVAVNIKQPEPVSIKAPTVSSRLLRGTAASQARTKELNLRRSTIGGNKSILPQKRDGDDGVEKARDRVRQRKLQQMSLTSLSKENHVNARFSMGASPTKSKKNLRKATTRTAQVKKQATSPQSQAVKSSLTVPQAPRFATTARFGEKRAADTSGTTRQSFGKVLRSNDSPTKNERSALTVPKAPVFATSARHGDKMGVRQNAADTALARSTNILASTLRTDISGTETKREARLTVPQAPKFHQIHKRELPKSTDERIKDEMEFYETHPFKARPLTSTGHASKTTTNNSRSSPIKRSAEPDASGKQLPNTKRRTVTKPEPFHFAVNLTKSAKSATRGRASPSSRSNTVKTFKAKPAPKTTYNYQPPSLPARTTTAVTRPFAPNLLTSNRNQPRQAVAEASRRSAEKLRAEKQKSAEKLKRSRHQQQMVKVDMPDVVSPVPFKFETDKRHEAHQKALNERLKLEEEKRQKEMFHALPLKTPPPPPPSEVHSAKKPTSPQPFHLTSIERHEAAKQNLEKKIAEEEEKRKKEAIPRPNPVPKTTYTYTPIVDYGA